MFDFSEQPPILYFHSVAPQKHPYWIRSYLTLELIYFEDLLKYITHKKFKTFFISELNDKSYNVKNSIGLTFDDGYLDNYVYIFPLLRKYNVKATIFCSVDYIDNSSIVRPTLENVWNGDVLNSEIKCWGFCNTEELKIMEESGLIDIQSHTVTHDKIPISDRIIDLHHPGNNKINFYLNDNPQIKPDYINNSNFIIPYGLPIYEEKSAIMSPRVWINKEFNETVVKSLSDRNWKNYNFDEFFNSIQPIYQEYRRRGEIISKSETYEEYVKRIEYEIFHSKKFLEKVLNKRISVICWPHGDFNKLSIELARNAGYTKLHFVETKSDKVVPSEDHFIRIGMGSVYENRFITMTKVKFKINTKRNIVPYKTIRNIYHLLK
jgi:peptidoglycan/xylan/chitin deacetylase (PgdA/CDA1 family)